jgi:dienelactone hydrolase
MMVADVYSGLRYLATIPEIDPRRAVLAGFSYGAMAAIYAIFAQLADKLSPDGLHFAGHVAFYGPCIARFADARTTGAPLLMLYGAQDEIVSPQRCGQLTDDLRRGGSKVETIVYPNAVHQWDGAFERRLIGRNLARCRFTVQPDGTIRDDRLGMDMTSVFRRKISLALWTTGQPYPIGRDDAIRARSNRDFGQFLAGLFY